MYTFSVEAKDVSSTIESQQVCGDILHEVLRTWGFCEHSAVCRSVTWWCVCFLFSVSLYLASSGDCGITTLVALTQRFLDLLLVQRDGVIDLNAVSGHLEVPKRRMYDVTNVLEGIGLIQKTAKNLVQWWWVSFEWSAWWKVFEKHKYIALLKGDVHPKMKISHLVVFGALSRMVKVRGHKPLWVCTRLNQLCHPHVMTS